MPKKQVRKYQVVEDAEINLVLECRDSGEFYSRYQAEFPDKQKDLDALARIWKRRSEFAKKRQVTLPSAETAKKPAADIQKMIAEQTKILSAILAVQQENLAVNREILVALKNQHQHRSGNLAHTEKKHRPIIVPPELPAPAMLPKKVSKKLMPIMVGS